MPYKEYDDLKRKVTELFARMKLDDGLFDDWFDHMYQNNREALEDMVRSES